MPEWLKDALAGAVIVCVVIGLMWLALITIGGIQ